MWTFVSDQKTSLQDIDIYHLHFIYRYAFLCHVRIFVIIPSKCPKCPLFGQKCLFLQNLSDIHYWKNTRGHLFQIRKPVYRTLIYIIYTLYIGMHSFVMFGSLSSYLLNVQNVRFLVRNVYFSKICQIFTIEKTLVDMCFRSRQHYFSIG